MYAWPDPIGTALHENDILATLTRLQRNGLPARPVAFYGSSSFRMWSGMAEDLGTLNAVNLGFGGGTFLSAIHYMDRLLRPLDAERIVLYFGENDIASDGLRAETALAHLAELLDRIQTAQPEAQVWVLGVKHSPARWIYAAGVERFNALAEAYCAGRPRVFRADISTGLMGENGLPMQRCFLPDMIHLNPAGYAVWSEALCRIPGLLGG